MHRSLTMATGLAFAWALACLSSVVLGQQQCYYGKGAQYRAPSQVVPCNGTGASACCLLGDTCLSGNTCYNHATGNLYQYGCTDINYQDSSCPFKCGFDPNRSPWIALEYCNDVSDLTNTWICHGPESCGCEWESTYDLLVLQPRGCKDMGSDAYVALYAPSKLAPYVSLPSSIGGSTGYYSPTISDGTSSWVETAIAGYTPRPFTQLTTYRAAPTTAEQIDPNATPGPSTYAPASSYVAPATRTASTTSERRTSSVTSTETSSTTSAIASASATTAVASSILSTGAKVGIGVGAAGGVCLLAATAIACFLIRRRKNKQKQSNTHQPAPSYPHSGTPHMQAMNWTYNNNTNTSHMIPGSPDPYYTYHHHQDNMNISPHTAPSDMSRHKFQRAPSYDRVFPGRSPPPPPMPSPPMELSAEVVPPQVHEIASPSDRTGRVMALKSTPSPGPGPTYTRDNRF